MSKQRRDAEDNKVVDITKTDENAAKEADFTANADGATPLSNEDIDAAVEEAQTNNVVSPAGLSKLTDDTMTVLGVFVKHRNRALAVQEVETILTALLVETVTDVEDCFTELEANTLIVECPEEVHEFGSANCYGDTDGTPIGTQSRYRLV